jgi:hypothetical protein
MKGELPMNMGKPLTLRCGSRIMGIICFVMPLFDFGTEKSQRIWSRKPFGRATPISTIIMGT